MSRATLNSAAPRPRRRRRGGFWTPRYWFLLPAVIWAVVFTLYPIVYTLVLSFQRSRLGQRNSFTGLTNYVRTYGDLQFWQSLSFTLAFVLVTVTVQVALGLGLALLVNREMRARNLVRALLIVPLFATPVGIGYLGIAMLQSEVGPINQMLMSLGGLFGVAPELMDIPWRSSALWARVAVGLMDTWQWTPFCFLILLAGLQSIPDELYEAARLETARKWQLFRFITLPLLMPVLGVTVLLRLVEAFKLIDVPFAFTKGGPGVATQSYTMYVWRAAFTSFDLGYASALGILFLVIVLVIVNVTIWAGRLKGSLFSE